MWPAFPASDYYGSSVPTRGLPSTPEIADALHVGGRVRVPAFRSNTCGPYRRLALPLRALATDEDEKSPSLHRPVDATRPDIRADPVHARSPHAVPYCGGFTVNTEASIASFVFLAIGPVVARLSDGQVANRYS